MIILPCNQWPGKALLDSFDEYARQEQEVCRRFGDKVSLSTIKNMVMRQWVDTISPAGTA